MMKAELHTPRPILWVHEMQTWNASLHFTISIAAGAAVGTVETEGRVAVPFIIMTTTDIRD